ncbi:hypothetical protein OIU77_011598 [Salix suchowensis]|uniref:Uncharacterized protein n=1 Tax=Salix suchowensis TaxID=1278906 RepID=A0ABQ9A0V6_9ROSI|nr:hypothetical protein OIU77_011598 [Salix suchowensis]
MATSISATGFTGGFGSSIGGEDYAMLVKSVPSHVRAGKPVRLAPMMKNVNEGKGLFRAYRCHHASSGWQERGSISLEAKQLPYTHR